MLLVFLLNILVLSNGANILGIVPTPSFSHQSTFWPIWKELSQRGHHVTVITTNPMKDATLTNLTEINVEGAKKYWDVLYDNIDRINPLSIIDLFQRQMHLITEYILEQKQVRQLTATNSSTSYDLVMVEALFPEFLALSERFKCPSVLLSSLDALMIAHEKMGNSIHPTLYPEVMLPFYRNLTFTERLISTLYAAYIMFKRYTQFMPQKDRLMKKYLGNDLPSSLQLLDKVSMLFVNIHPALQGVRLLGPATVTFGGMVHIRDPQPLPKDLKRFLDESKEGVIYFSLGSNVRSSELNNNNIQTITDAFSQLPYKVLWKFEGNQLPGKPDNVKLIKWAPQQDILRHPNVKAFVTQGGLQSLEEAIYTRTPMLVLPVYGDQQKNAKIVESKNIGKVIYNIKNGLNREDLVESIIELVSNTSYRKNMRSLANLMLDEPMSGVEKVVWWSEYVIRNKGAKHLRNHILDIPLYQYLMLDVTLFLIAVVTIFVVLLVFLYRICRYFIVVNVGKVIVKTKKE